MIIDHEVKEINVADIVLDGDNPNQMNDQRKRALKESMSEFGYAQFVVVDKNTMILADGEHRLNEFKKQGLKKIKVIMIPFKDDAHRRAFRQAANKIRGEHLQDLDIKEYLKIIDGGYKDILAHIITMPLSEIKAHLRRLELTSRDETFDVEEAMQAENRPTSVKKGDIWKLGDHFLLCGDSTKKEDIDKLMQGKTAIACITDPPYSVGYGDIKRRLGEPTRKQRGDTFVDAIEVSEVLKFIDLIPSEMLVMTYPLTKHFHELADSTRAWDPLYDLIWVKQHFAFNMRRRFQQQHEGIFIFRRKKGKGVFNIPHNQSTVFHYDKPSKNIEHPTIKPVELFIDFITFHSNMGDIVYEPFSGSGTTIIACEKLNRKCYAMEIDTVYCQVTIDRWESFTGQKAELMK